MSRVITVDPTGALTLCHKCRKTGVPISRHHKGNDAFLSIYNWRIRRDYDKFLDCVPICDDCHMEIHWLYKPFEESHTDWSVKGTFALRTLLIDVCDQWLSGSLTPEKQGRPITQEFRDRWHRTKEKQETG